MTRSRASLIVFACLAFLSMQATGTHFHAGIGEHAAGDHHGLHLQHAFAADHVDDDQHADVSLFDPLPGSDVEQDDWLVTLSLPGFSGKLAIAAGPRAPPSLSGRSQRTRWRPPLRAPPSHI